MARQMINHLGPEFAGVLGEVINGLKELFQTRNDVLLFTCSGSGGLEAAIVNTLSPGDKVLSVIIGFFGERFAYFAGAHGVRVVPLSFEWGRAADVDELRKALDSDPEIKAVLVTHNETSTGVTNDLGAISSVVKDYDKLLLVDAVSSLGSIDLPVDEWHCDIVITASQKGWMAPPGLAMISVSPEGWKAHARSSMPRAYFDFAYTRDCIEKGYLPWTPAVSLLFALSVSLKMMREEGLTRIVARHARVARAAREGVKSLGLSLFADEDHASNTVTVPKAPRDVDVNRLLTILREDYHVVLGAGYQRLAESIFRIGHLGWVTTDDIEGVISALRTALPRARVSPT
jgi:aspartate aminotransferase-like enzyme